MQSLTLSRQTYDPWYRMLISQLGWFIDVYGHAWHYSTPASLLTMVLLMAHVYRTRYQREWLLMVILLMIGWVVEFLLLRSHLIIYVGTAPNSLWPPIWVLLLWPLFGILLPVWQQKMTTLPWQILMGFLCPLAYAAGAHAGAAILPHPAYDFCMMSILWSCLLPALLGLSRHFSLAR